MIEKQTLADGFRIGLLGVAADRGRGALAYRATLFDGGRQVSTVHHQTPLPQPPAAALKDLCAFAAPLAPPPHVLAAFGRGWRELLAQVLPDDVLGELRVLDLLKTAAALHPGLTPRDGTEAIRQAYGLGPGPDAESLDSPLYEAILWAVIRRADTLGLDWPALLTADAAVRQQVPFERYAFDEITLAAVPPAPGVYVMRDRAGETLYVGKSANLARRLGEYFRATRDLPAKLEAIRSRIRDFECHPVGSELEALLLEHRLIAARLPGLNVQRTIAEGASRYAFPLLPILIICPSAQAGALELFICGAGTHAFQCRARPARWPRQTVMRLAQAAQGYRRASKLPRAVTDWGIEGNEICCRYFARFKDRLNWLQLSRDVTAGAFVAALDGILRRAAAEPRDAAEFRLADSAEA